MNGFPSATATATFVVIAQLVLAVSLGGKCVCINIFFAWYFGFFFFFFIYSVFVFFLFFFCNDRVGNGPESLWEQRPPGTFEEKQFIESFYFTFFYTDRGFVCFSGKISFDEFTVQLIGHVDTFWEMIFKTSVLVFFSRFRRNTCISAAFDRGLILFFGFC